MNEALLSVKNASGRQVSLLNTAEPSARQPTSPNSYSSDEAAWQQDPQQSKRKYHCTEPGCNKSFTTSGHLARHNRIHTGEKNFPCLFPGCQSRFSRQDNMMQHYRTHMSPKSRRSQKRGAAEETRPRPRLHAHHRIRSDPVRVEPPLTIDQHLSNYHQSLRTSTPITERFSPVRFNFPSPLSSAARSPTNLKKVNQPQTPTSSATVASIESNSPSPTLSHSSSSTSLPSIQQIIESRPTSPDHEEQQQLQLQHQYQYQQHQYQLQQQTLPLQQQQHELPSLNSSASSTLFYQHRPLTYTKPTTTTFPYTLLHPAQQQEETVFNVSQKSGNTPFSPEDKKEDPMDEDDNNNSPSSSGLLQLAHIVSTFG